MAKATPDPIFALAEMPDPFLSNPYLAALMALDPIDRRRIVSQAAALCAVVDGLDMLDALALLGQIGIFLAEVNR